jgi:hypothetical protein
MVSLTRASARKKTCLVLKLSENSADIAGASYSKKKTTEYRTRTDDAASYEEEIKNESANVTSQNW